MINKRIIIIISSLNTDNRVLPVIGHLPKYEHYITIKVIEKSKNYVTSAQLAISLPKVFDYTLNFD